MKTITDANGTITYAHNNPGGAASGETFSGGIMDGLILSYPAAAGGLRQSFTASLGGANLSQMSYGYSAQSRLQTVSDPNIGFSATYGYTPDSDLIKSVTNRDANGAIVLTGVRNHDNAHQLDDISYTRGDGAVVSSHDYTLDDGFRRVRADRENGEYWIYGYNDRSEVTSAKKHLPSGASIAGWQQEYKYDNIGNRIWKKEGGDSVGSNLRQTDYAATNHNQYSRVSHPEAFSVVGKAPQSVAVTVNGQATTRQGDYWHYEFTDLDTTQGALNQQVDVKATDPGAGPNGEDIFEIKRRNGFVPPVFEIPVYDDDGNLLSDGRWNYIWNGENRLVQMETGAAALIAGVPKERFTFYYDSQGRRFRKRVEKWNLTTAAYEQLYDERFVYDQWNVVAVLNENNAVKRRNAWGTDLSGTPQGAGGVGGLLATRDSEMVRSWVYAYDGNGNVSCVLDVANSQTGNYDYDAFGKTIAVWGDDGLAEANRYRFSTKPADETGLLYYGFRYYMPETGRWASRDPIEERGGVNLYGFVRNDGVGNRDYLGLMSIFKKKKPQHIEVVVHTNYDLPQATIDEITRIFYDCVDTCPSACGVTGDFEVHYSPTGPYPSVGCKRSSPTEVTCTGFVSVENLPKLYGPRGYTDPNGFATVYRNRAMEDARKYKMDPDLTLATGIAHEVLHHGISGTKGHWSGGKNGWVDSKGGFVSTPTKAAQLSPGACEKLCKKLDLD